MNWVQPPDKELEKIVEKLMQETSLEKPSPDFTSKVMFQVYAANTGTATVYKPLISKRTWFVIFESSWSYWLLLLAREMHNPVPG